MGIEFDIVEGQTPLDEDEREGLRIPAVSTRSELDEFEQHNIEDAIAWTLSRSFKQENVFTESFVKEVHIKMFGDVWKWAGEFRKSNKNLGVEKWNIGSELKQLNDDALFWISNEVYGPDELAIRYKHRLVSIHCFPNGNGRHSRLMADIVIEKILKKPVFTWGMAGDNLDRNIRQEYIKAIKAADKGNYKPLISFARS
jgi:Fic-DOC domain mobile mystery protein B